MSDSELRDLEDLLARALPDPPAFGRRIMEQLMGRLAADQPTITVTAPADETLQDRNLLLAAALGACECWGSDAECRSCAGEGRPGWTLPDPQLYQEYVSPAVSAMAAATDIATRQSEDRAEGKIHDLDVAGQQ